MTIEHKSIKLIPGQDQRPGQRELWNNNDMDLISSREQFAGSAFIVRGSSSINSNRLDETAQTWAEGGEGDDDALKYVITGRHSLCFTPSPGLH